MFIKTLNVGPVKLYLLLLLFWVVLWLSSPIEYEVSLSYFNVLILLILHGFFFLGFYMGQVVGAGRGIRFEVVSLSSSLANALLFKVFLLGGVGFVLKMYTLFFVKGAPLTLNPILIRMSMLDDIGAGQGGVFSIISAVLFPYCLIYFPIYFSVSGRRGWRERLMFNCMVVFILFDAFLTGGGTSIVIVFLYFIFSTRNAGLTRSKFILVSIGVFGVFFIASMFWLGRLDAMYGGVEPYLNEFNGAWIASYPKSYLSGYESASIWSNLGYIYSWISYYFVHGVFEFIYLMNNFDSSLHTMGVNQGYLFYKFLGMVGVDVPAASELAELNVIQGHYQTFWGLAYIDFGYFFLLQALAVGFLCTYMYKKKKHGYFSGVLFYPFIQTQLVYSFLSNPLNGQVTYLLVSGVILLVYVSSRYGRGLK